MASPGDCRHFNGVMGPGTSVDHRCKAGVLYPTVCDSSVSPYRWPCLEGTFGSCATSCAAYEPLTEHEVAADDARINQAVDDIFAGLCPQCGRVCEERENKHVKILVCPEHGGVMRGCKRIGEPCDS